jgi:hypothetical protein
MIEQLFGSKTRVILMKIFLENPKEKFYVRELTRLSGALINSVRRELDNLMSVNLLKIVVDDEEKNCSPEQENRTVKKTVNMKKFYQLNKDNFMIDELMSLFNKNKSMIEKNFAEKLKNVGKINYLALSGMFIDKKKTSTDLIVVGSFEKKKMIEAIKDFEKNIGRSINFTIMDLKEYRLRKDIADKFLNDIMTQEGNIVIVDELKILEALQV